MKPRHDMKVRMIPISQIAILNHRDRGQTRFKQIVANIAELGMKNPVILARREKQDNGLKYDLVCGEGRIESMKALGETEVPALIIDATREELLLMSLVENIARRSRHTLEMAREIGAMRQRGDKPPEIARKIGVDPVYVNGILRLLKHGEERLIVAVHRRQIPLTVAMQIAESDDPEIQRALAEAYEKGSLKGRALKAARKLIEMRRARGKGSRDQGPKTEGLTANGLMKAYRKESQLQRILVNRAQMGEMRLTFIVSAFKKLMADEGLVNLLRAEGLTDFPQYLAGRISRMKTSLGT